MPDTPAAAVDPMLQMRRRFIEALRRAEIIALANAATSVDGLARDLSEELCEVYEAEIGFVLDCGSGEDGWAVLGATGTPEVELGRLSRWQPARTALAGETAVTANGEDVSILGGGSALVAPYVSAAARRVLIGVVRLYELEFEPPEIALIEAVTRSAGLALDRLWLQDERERLIRELREAMLGTAAALANALEARDDYTAGHAREIAELAVAVGERLGMDPSELEELRFGGIFHDIGKIAVPDGILLKPEPLSDPERTLMERHTLVGQQILAPVPNMAGVGKLVRASHERWDGGGYPDGLAGEAIPLGARILSVVDAWHAMTSDRPYRKALANDVAAAELRAHEGTQFDPAAVEAFLSLLRSAGGS